MLFSLLCSASALSLLSLHSPLPPLFTPPPLLPFSFSPYPSLSSPFAPLCSPLAHPLTPHPPTQTFKAASTYSTTDYDALSSQSHLIKRAIAMHLIREGQFATSALFLTEAGPIDIPSSLQSEFITLYEILDAMRAHDLNPAIHWTRSKAHLLDPRGSNLEFKLCKLRFIHLFNNDWRDALRYARTEFHRFLEKHLVDVQKLMCAFLYLPDGGDYAHLFANPERAWADVAHAFTREFCSLLGLAAESPLYIAATAGAIALPTLLKMAAIMKDKKTEWSTVNELPVHPPFSLSPLTLHSPTHSPTYSLSNTAPPTGRDRAPTRIPIPFHLRMPRIQRPNDRIQPTNDAPMRPRNRPRESAAPRKGREHRESKVSLLSARVQSLPGKEGRYLGCPNFLSSPGVHFFIAVGVFFFGLGRMQDAGCRMGIGLNGIQCKDLIMSLRWSSTPSQKKNLDLSSDGP